MENVTMENITEVEAKYLLRWALVAQGILSEEELAADDESVDVFTQEEYSERIGDLLDRGYHLESSEYRTETWRLGRLKSGPITWLHLHF